MFFHAYLPASQIVTHLILAYVWCTYFVLGVFKITEDQAALRGDD